jgi:tetratricopeptide (TPR) repeat protein
MLPKPTPPPHRRSRYQNLIFDADRFFAAKDYETAFQIYQQALREAPPGENYPYAQLCRCYRKKARKLQKKQNWPALVVCLEEMLQINGSRPNLKALDFQALAEAYLEQQQPEAAQTALDQALKLQPTLKAELQTLYNRVRAECLHRDLRGLF